MAYRDPQDLARERDRESRAHERTALAERRTELAEAGARGRSIFCDERLAHLDELTRVRLEREGGYTHPADLAEAQAAARERFEPILAESPNMPLDQFKEIVRAVDRPKLTEAQVAERADQLAELRVPVYQPKQSGPERLAAVNQTLKAERPILNALLKETGAGNSVPLARSLLAEAESPSSRW